MPFAGYLVKASDAAYGFHQGQLRNFVWFDEQLEAGRREILPGLTYLLSGDVIDIGEDGERIRIGGCHAPSSYERCSQ